MFCNAKHCWIESCVQPTAAAATAAAAAAATATPPPAEAARLLHGLRMRDRVQKETRYRSLQQQQKQNQQLKQLTCYTDRGYEALCKMRPITAAFSSSLQQQKQKQKRPWLLRSGGNIANAAHCKGCDPKGERSKSRFPKSKTSTIGHAMSRLHNNLVVLNECFRPT